MIAEVFGLDVIPIVVILAILMAVIAAIIQVAKAPGLSRGAKAWWIIALIVGWWFFWIPGLVLAIVVFSIKGRWTEQSPDGRTFP